MLYTVNLTKKCFWLFRMLIYTNQNLEVTVLGVILTRDKIIFKWKETKGGRSVLQELSRVGSFQYRV